VTRSVRGAAMVALSVCAIIGTVGCGSSGSSGGAKGSSSSGATSAAQLAAATRVVNEYLKTPTKIPVSTPLKARPPSGKTIVFMQCDVSQCAEQGAGIKAAAAALGWTGKIIPYQSANPASLVAGMKQALQYHPVATVVGALGYSVWKSVVPAYAQAGVPIIGFFDSTPITKTIVGSIGSNSRYAAAGNILGDWAIAHSKGHAHALIWTIPQYNVQVTWANALKNTLEKGCSGCTATVLDTSAADLTSGAAPQEIVSAVKRDPSINYILLSDTGFVPSLPETLKTAGVTNVTIAGDSGLAVNEQDLKSGTESAIVTLPLRETAWTVVDLAARHLEGMTYPSDDGGLGGMVMQILTKSNVGTPSDDYQAPSNYQQQFERLWHVG